MEQESIVNAIPFKPLLHAPIFSSHPLSENDCFVAVCAANTPRTYVFFGGEHGGYEESAERASKKIALFLVNEFNLRIDDVNLSLWDQSEVVVSVFRLKRKQLDCVEKGVPTCPLDAELMPLSTPGVHPVTSIDFYGLLEKVIDKFQIVVTPVEHLQYDINDYQAWMSVVCAKGIVKIKWILGDQCSTLAQAVQNLSKRVFQFLTDVYDFHVEDVSYHFIQFVSVASSLERESYLTIRERIHGAAEDVRARPVLQQKIDVTPTTMDSVIPAILPQPNPTKKRPYASSSRSFSDVILDSLIPSQLESVLPRKKTA